MERFHPTTTAEEARALTVGCLQAIAAGWSLVYMRQGKLPTLLGQPSLEPDMDRMIADAADIAARITQAAAMRTPKECSCSADVSGYHSFDPTHEKACVHCGKQF